MKKRLQTGFSLIELLVVVAIIGVLAGAGVYAYTQYLNSVNKDTSQNNLSNISSALDKDVLAAINKVAGSTDLTADRTEVARLLSSDALTIDPNSCEVFAVSAVRSINAKSKNPYNKEYPAAVYGNIIETGDDGRVVGPAGFKLTRGTIVVSCNDPTLLMSESSTVRLYQCVCAEDSDDQCRFSSNTETQAAIAAKTAYSDTNCPRPEVTRTGFPSGSSPARPLR
jgi:prepilin-type N-terminal cleavage/methylation domain-containing protein